MNKYLWIFPFLFFLGGYVALDTIYHQEEIETPTLVGKNIQEAIKILSNNNLNARLIKEKEEAMLEEGTIISQMPAPAQKIKENQSVFLVLSTKPKKIKVPQLLGKPLSTIETELAQLGIRFKSHAIQTIYPTDQCVAQHPRDGEYLESPDMHIYVSSGSPKTVLIPNLTNKPLNLVLELLKTQTVIPEIIHYPGIPEDHSCTHCSVIDQRPVAGTITTIHEDKPLHMQLRVKYS